MLQHLQKCIIFGSYNDGMWRFTAVPAPFNADMYNLQPISLETHPLHFSKLKTNFFLTNEKWQWNQEHNKLFYQQKAKTGVSPHHTQSCQSWQGAQRALSPHTFALPAFICLEKNVCFQFPAISCPAEKWEAPKSETNSGKMTLFLLFNSLEYLLRRHSVHRNYRSLYLFERLWFLNHLFLVIVKINFKTPGSFILFKNN